MLRIECRYEGGMMKCRGGGKQRNLQEIPGQCEKDFSFLVLCFCLCSGVWKVVWSQQAFSGVLQTELV